MTSYTTILFIILPIFCAGISFILILKIKALNFLSYPLDFDLRYKGKRIFGDNKTFRGPLVMGICTSLYGLIFSKSLSNPLSLDQKEILFNFFLIGVFYSLGELPNSFFKRQLNILPGKSPSERIKKRVFRLTDTFDSLLLCGVGYAVFFKLPVNSIIIAILLGGILHLLTDRLMISLSLKQE